MERNSPHLAGNACLVCAHSARGNKIEICRGATCTGELLASRNPRFSWLSRSLIILIKKLKTRGIRYLAMLGLLCMCILAISCNLGISWVCVLSRSVEVTLHTDDTGAQTLESPNPSIAGGFPLQVRRSPQISAVFGSGYGNHKAICP